MRKLISLLVVCVLAMSLSGCRNTNNPTPNDPIEREEPHSPSGEDEIVLKKPNIYLYGYDGDVKVKFGKDIEERLICTYPEYNNGWNLSANKTGELLDDKGNSYQYLFWEGKSNHDYRVTDGFCVKGSETAEFLNEKLTILGLNDKERDDFITYWLPDMVRNPWNIISFKTDEYDEYTELNVFPAPKNKVRILMVWYPWMTKLTMNEQVLTPVEIDRNEKTVVEWGGLQVGELGGFDNDNKNHIH